MKDEINIQIINNCNLNCIFCPRSNLNKSEVIKNSKMTQSLEIFKQIVDECLTLEDLTKICLTPRMGEPLLDNYLMEKLNYLKLQNQITEIFFSTNFTIDARTLLKNLGNKISLQISHLGNRERFKKITQTNSDNLYDTYLNNIRFCIANPKFCKNLTFYQRYVGDIECIELDILLKTTAANYDKTETLNYNLGGHLINQVDEYSKIKRIGKCPTKETGCILMDGDYNLCYMNDLLNETTQGNILKKSIKTFKNNEYNIMYNICKKCNENWENINDNK